MIQTVQTLKSLVLSNSHTLCACISRGLNVLLHRAKSFFLIRITNQYFLEYRSYGILQMSSHQWEFHMAIRNRTCSSRTQA